MIFLESLIFHFTFTLKVQVKLIIYINTRSIGVWEDMKFSEIGLLTNYVRIGRIDHHAYGMRMK